MVSWARECKHPLLPSFLLLVAARQRDGPKISVEIDLTQQDAAEVRHRDFGDKLYEARDVSLCVILVRVGVHLAPATAMTRLSAAEANVRDDC